ncbi:MAG: hypothetical protein LBM20_05040 [Rikenellaceae bacterium]|jgi:hypothetical protein|nr:hypothetical protein [Rikenellaceae bacterium]
MKLRACILILSMLTTLSLHGQTITEANKDSLKRIGLSEVAFIIDQIENNYISGRRGLSDSAWNSGVERVNAEVERFFDNGGQGYYVYLLRYLNLLRDDAHFKFPDTGMYNRWRVFEKEDALFPLWVQTWDDGSVYNVKDFTGKIPRYAQIHTINGQSAQEIALLSRALCPGEDANAMAMMNADYEASARSWPNFTNHLFMEMTLGRMYLPFEVVYSLPESNRLDTTVLYPITREQKHKLSKKSENRRLKGELVGGKPVVYENVGDGIGVLSINMFWGKRWGAMLLFGKDWRYKRLIRGAMRRIDRDNIEELVVDVSRNSGGMRENLYYTLNYFTDQPIDMNKVFLVTEASREKLQTNLSNSPEIEESDRERLIEYVGGVASGTRFSTDTVCNLQYLPDNPKHGFRGKVYVLTSPITYSAGQMFAQYCQTLGIGLTAGQHSGGYRAITGGNLANITLPWVNWLEFGVPFSLEGLEKAEGELYEYPDVDLLIDHPFSEWLERENHSLERLVEMLRSDEI